MKKLHRYLYNLPRFQYILIAVIPQLILIFILYYLFEYNVEPLPPDMLKSNNWMCSSFAGFFIASIAAPFVETLLIQTIIVGLFILYFPNSKKMQIMGVFVSSIAFGFLHLFNTSDMYWGIFWALRAGLMGIILAYTYILYYYKTKRHTTSIWMTFLVHATNNFLSVVVTILLKVSFGI